jgi:hypothetical protein
MYRSIFPPADTVGEQQDKGPVSKPISGADAHRSYGAIPS